MCLEQFKCLKARFSALILELFSNNVEWVCYESTLTVLSVGHFF